MDAKGLVIVLLLLAVVVAATLALAAYDPLDLALARAQAGMDAAALTVSPAGALGGFALRAVIVVVALVLVGALAFLAWERVQARREGGGWTPGPNARWGRQSLGGRKPSLTDLMEYQLYRQLLRDAAPRYDAQQERIEF